MTGKETDRKQKVQKKKREQRLKPTLGGKERQRTTKSQKRTFEEHRPIELYLRSETLFDNTHYIPDHTSSAKTVLSVK